MRTTLWRFLKGSNLLQIDDEHLHLALEPRFLLLQSGAFGDEGVDLLLQFRDADVELSPIKSQIKWWSYETGTQTKQRKMKDQGRGGNKDATKRQWRKTVNTS